MKYLIPSLVALFFCTMTAFAAPHSARIVDFGAKLGTGLYQGRSPQTFPPEKDRDGNGTMDNDTVSAWPFSLEKPLSAPGLDFDTDAKNAVFYGGLTIYIVNNPNRKLTEGHPNTNHEFMDDLNFMALAQPATNELFEGYATWFWQKPDFQNGGDLYPVSFDDKSFICVNISRYWGGLNAGRWLVRDGDDFYLSQATFAGENRSFFVGTDPSNPSLDGANNPVVRTTQTLNPNSTAWAEYHPEAPFKLDFNDGTASFEPHVFTNITAVGFFANRKLAEPQTVAKGLLSHQSLALKWNAFRCDAVIDRPETPSFYADMTPITAGGKTAFLERTAVSYELWKKVWRNAVTRQYTRNLGDLSYIFLRDGAMGSMRADGQSHSGKEAVTEISWWDAALFCNALSELEGRTPCYYTDADYKTILRKLGDRDQIGGLDKRPDIYWKQDADGFRLPTAAEWSQGVASGIAEYIWDASGDVCRGDNTTRTLLGKAAPATTDLPFAEKPAFGSYCIGFRIASGTPLSGSSAKDVPIWTMDEKTVLQPKTPVTLEGWRERVAAQLKLVSVPDAGLAPEAPVLDRQFDPYKTPKAKPAYPLAFERSEVSYKLWNDVRNWAESAGYTFNYAGEMGSSSHATGQYTYSPEEPVTMISLCDAVAWCNALSELMGRKPVYACDEAGTEVYRHALPFRLDMCQSEGYPNWPFRTNLPKNWTIHTGSYAPIYMHATANGFRLPLPDEWKKANKPSDTNNPLDSEWLAGNSGDKTQPVGTKAPNVAGLCDMEGNVVELMWGNTSAAINGAPQRLGGYFFRDFRARHPSIDIYEFAAVARSYVGFRFVSREE